MPDGSPVEIVPINSRVVSMDTRVRTRDTMASGVTACSGHHLKGPHGMGEAMDPNPGVYNGTPPSAHSVVPPRRGEAESLRSCHEAEDSAFSKA